ncbi:folate-binding protein YgfZ [Novosphingobium sp. 9U]|uniref:CAF17-like 4Fe-4S cluster assembly/insertion protein YgfZ n=1 Tax=Novosphingobium sp. 9U TaxID=2653158 RepID=UPI00135A0D8C|nr:folate-binding protein [Novosphingobium sp. 9U]
MTATRLARRAVIRISPHKSLGEGSSEDVAAFLQGLVTSDVTGTLPVWSALLSPQGKALFDFLVWRSDDDLLIDCEAEVAETLTKRLSMYRLRRAIDIAVDPTLAVYWTKEPNEGSLPDPRLAALGSRWIGPADGGPNSAEASADDAYLANRLTEGVAEGRAELGQDATLWLECNAVELNGVSFTKGCYIGQENTARMNWRQKVNRRLIVVPLDRSDPKRQRVAYPELGLAVDHLRVEDIDPQLAPAWMNLDPAAS